jgi:uncharacterized protein YndB with AHSA1/START domain
MWLLMPSVRREVVLPVKPDRAWELITDPSELEGWLADEVELEPEEGGDVRVRFEDGEERWGTVEEVDPERRLAFVWGDSRVEWVLEPVEEGTRLVVVERSLSPVVGPLSLAPVVGPRMPALQAQASLCLA